MSQALKAVELAPNLQQAWRILYASPKTIPNRPSDLLCLRALVQCEPRDHTYQLLYARTALWTAQYDDAAQAARAAWALQPYDDEARGILNAALVLGAMAERRETPALFAESLAFGQLGKHVVGASLRQNMHVPQIRQALQHLLELDPNNAIAQQLLAETHSPL